MNGRRTPRRQSNEAVLYYCQHGAFTRERATPRMARGSPAPLKATASSSASGQAGVETIGAHVDIGERVATFPDREARLELLFDRHAAAVLAYAMRRTFPAAAADVVSETYLVAWRRLESIPSDAALPWLYATARNVLASQRRSDRRQIAVTIRLESELRLQQTAEVATAADAPVLNALATITLAEREVLMLDAWENLSSSEAAAVLGCSATAYRIRLHRARKRLIRALETIAGTSALAQPQLGRPMKETG